MENTNNKETVREFFDRFSAADVQGAVSLLDDSVIWRAMGREGGLPMSGEMNKEGIAALIEMVRDTFPDKLALTPTGWTVEGDRVAVEMESYGKKADRTVYNNMYHFLVTLSHGKIIHLKEYMDTYHVKKVFIDQG